MTEVAKTLQLTFHGRIIDQLGIQMYQSPVAAVAELVSNAWDADAENVYIHLPVHPGEDAEFVMRDDGLGMTFQECQERYLNVGWCRRGENPDERSPEKERSVLGRKGIGKFAGFGIAEIMRIETISKATGEKTVFELNINDLRSHQYVSTVGKEISVIEYLEPDEERKGEHGTLISLKSLRMGKKPSKIVFSKSMARRFLLHQRTADFAVYVNDDALPEGEELEKIEFVYPRDYAVKERPEGLSFDGDWGVETLSNGYSVRWRFVFYLDPIEEEELRGVAIFTKIKLAQRPFFFNLTGGLGGQHGLEYLSGQVIADYIDLMEEDIIATERQRVNWEHHAAAPLEEWGQKTIKGLLRIWRDRRGEKRRTEIEEKVAGFSARLEKLPAHEKKTVKTALTKLGSIPALSAPQFQELGGAILQAWEQGRLRALIDALSATEDISSDLMLSLLAEADVLVALNIAEAIKTKLVAIIGLRKKVEAEELETAVRDYIAEKPYLLHPKWETFKKEVSISHILEEAAEEAKIKEVDETYEKKRIDLALRSGEHLLVVEFMRPGKTADYDHLSRCRAYVHLVRDKVESQTALGIKKVTGLIVADKIDKTSLVKKEIPELEKTDIYVYSWRSLLSQAEETWREFIDIFIARAPSDERLKSLR